jgi:hypothetical protein
MGTKSFPIGKNRADLNWHGKKVVFWYFLSIHFFCILLIVHGEDDKKSLLIHISENAGTTFFIK